MNSVLEEAGFEKEEITDVLLVGGTTGCLWIRNWLRVYFEKEPDTRLNAHEAVAYGATMMAGKLGFDKYELGQNTNVAKVQDNPLQEYQLSDVTAISLCIKINGDQIEKVIPRNSPVPYQVEKEYETTNDNQQKISIDLLQGEAEAASNNTSLGRFCLENIPKGKAGSQKFNVSFLIDENHTVKVKAT